MVMSQQEVHDADLNLAAKVSFVQKCQAAGVHVEFGEDHLPAGHHEMLRRDSVAPPSERGTGTRGARAASATTTEGAKPAYFTGAAAPRDVTGSMLGLVAAVAAAAIF